MLVYHCPIVIWILQLKIDGFLPSNAGRVPLNPMSGHPFPQWRLVGNPLFPDPSCCHGPGTLQCKKVFETSNGKSILLPALRSYWTKKLAADGNSADKKIGCNACSLRAGKGLRYGKPWLRRSNASKSSK